MLTSKGWLSFKNRRGSAQKVRRGQSLVEFALTMPVLLTILAGVLEVANVLTIYNRVQLASREGARFGAMGGDNVDVMEIVNQTSENSLVVADDRMKVWAIRPTLNVTGGVWSWNGTGAAPASIWGPAPEVGKPPTVDCLFPAGCNDADIAAIPLTPQEVLGKMRGANNAYAGLSGDKFVIVVVSYQTDLLLNLPWFTREGGRFPMWSYAVLRQEVKEQAIAQKRAGCSAYGIAVSDVAIDAGLAADTTEPRQFIVNMNNEGAGPSGRQGFTFLAWRVGDQQPADLTSANLCGATMSFPGNSVGCDKSYVEYPDVEDPDDKSLHVGDWVVEHSNGTVDNVWSELVSQVGHFYTGRKLRIIVYAYNDGIAEPAKMNPKLDSLGSGLWLYQIKGFARVRLIQDGSAHEGGLNRFNFEWIDWDYTCGQPG